MRPAEAQAGVFAVSRAALVVKMQAPGTAHFDVRARPETHKIERIATEKAHDSVSKSGMAFNRNTGCGGARAAPRRAELPDTADPLDRAGSRGRYDRHRDADGRPENQRELGTAGNRRQPSGRRLRDRHR